MDAGLNTAVALSGRTRLLNLLHGAYGVGTALGPLVVTAAILTGSWRPAYLTLTALDLVIARLLAAALAAGRPGPGPGRPGPGRPGPGRPGPGWSGPGPSPGRSDPGRQSPGCPAALGPGVVPTPLRRSGSHRNGRVLPLTPASR